ncbi:microtubule-associated protein 6 isoform X2 [Cynoglossus semilaevis]|uniref:microtubule-associated protein 6 isoform X2 n=1 Tax=Cynoglossus semilaevis TaxID=244447 RepID=UPI0007DC9254|nr:microtubule-associated protein 6-like isoform X2 [Cynoglossus semilaevis]
MAWPCITRACCINRFWADLDKADIAVPLVFSRYSDVDAQHLLHQQRAAAVAIETQPQHLSGGEEGQQEEKAAVAGGAAAAKHGSAASVMRQDFRAWRVRPEPSCKPRDAYRPTSGPFNDVTQYQKDYKAWPLPRKYDHPWIRREGESGVEKSVREEKVKEKEEVKEKKELKAEKEMREENKETKKDEVEKQTKKMKEKKVEAEENEKKEEVVLKRSLKKEKEEQSRDRAVADALNKQIKKVIESSSYRTEFKAYKDVKPVKPIKAPSQYKPPKEETNLETSYSATFRGEQVKANPADNKLLERRRIRSLYSEPSKEAKTEKTPPHSKPKKTATTSTGKTMRKTKEKQIAGLQSAKKKPPHDLAAPSPAVTAAEAPPESGVTKKSKEISNRLAEAKQ